MGRELERTERGARLSKAQAEGGVEGVALARVTGLPPPRWQGQRGSMGNRDHELLMAKSW